jgi:hypothetical protein
VKHLPKKTKTQSNLPLKKNTEDRETKILTLLSNISLLLMTLLTEAFTDMFTNLSQDLITALTSSTSVIDDTTKNINDLQKKIPHHIQEELRTIKTDLTRQLNEKRQELEPILADPRFDQGLTIVERTPLHLPKLTQELDDQTLLSYLLLLQTNDPRFTPMFQELLEWMKTLPQPEMKK